MNRSWCKIGISNISRIRIIIRLNCYKNRWFDIFRTIIVKSLAIFVNWLFWNSYPPTSSLFVSLLPKHITYFFNNIVISVSIIIVYEFFALNFEFKWTLIDITMAGRKSVFWILLRSNLWKYNWIRHIWIIRFAPNF